MTEPHLYSQQVASSSSPAGLGKTSRTLAVPALATSSVLASVRTWTREDTLPLGLMAGVSVGVHVLVIVLAALILFLMQWLGWTTPLFEPLAFKERDLEFTLVESPEAKPRNPNTRLRSTKNSRSGGQRNRLREVAETIQAAGSRTPQARPAAIAQPAPQPAAKQAVRAQPRPQPRRQPSPRQPQKPAPPTPQPPRPQVAQQQPKASQAPKPTKTPEVAQAPPAPVPPLIKFPTTSSPPVPRPLPTGPVASALGKPGSSVHGGGSPASTEPAPSQLPGGFTPRPGGGRSGGRPGGSSHGSGGRGTMDQVGSPGGGGGRPGVDALAAPDYGAYMAELQRRIKRNWRPPSAQEDKRVVVRFTIGRDGRLMTLALQRSSGYSEADQAALSAIKLSAPFRPLPAGHREDDLPIEFTFDYNVYRSGGGLSFR